MEKIISLLQDFNYISIAVRLVLAMIIGGLIGIERGKHGRAAGLRTHILICAGATLTSLVSIYISQSMGFAIDITRISAQVVSGIGFLGVGTIIVKNRSIVTGLTTATGLWVTAVIGIAMGYGFYIGSILAAIICILSFTIFNFLEAKQKRSILVYVELNDVAAINKFNEYLKTNKYLILSDIMPSKSGKPDNVGVMLTLLDKEQYNDIEQDLKSIDEVEYFFNMIV